MTSGYDHVRFVIDGKVYRWSGYFGCQLESAERGCKVGDVRRILGRDMAVYTVSSDYFLRPRVTWCVESAGLTLDGHRERIDALANDLKRMMP